jgi:hypothetical protein
LTNKAWQIPQQILKTVRYMLGQASRQTRRRAFDLTLGQLMTLMA